MFQLIVIIIAIFVAIVLSIAAIYYGGNAFSTSDTRALYATYIAQGEQIQAGYKYQEATTGSLPSGSTTDAQFQSLMDNQYLSSIPGGTNAPNSWLVQDSQLYKPLTSTAQCVAFNKLSGKFDPTATYAGQATQGCPSCTDTNYSNWVSCQTDTPLDRTVTDTTASH